MDVKLIWLKCEYNEIKYNWDYLYLKLYSNCNCKLYSYRKYNFYTFLEYKFR